MSLVNKLSLSSPGQADLALIKEAAADQAQAQARDRAAEAQVLQVPPETLRSLHKAAEITLKGRQILDRFTETFFSYLFKAVPVAEAIPARDTMAEEAEGLS